MKSGRVLLIDADAVYRQICARYFKSQGFSVAESASAQQAIHGCEEKLPDIIVLDLQLISHSGVEFIHELRSYAEWRHIPIVLHTLVPPREMAGFESSFRAMGIRTVLHKSDTDLKKLTGAIQDVIASTV